MMVSLLPQWVNLDTAYATCSIGQDGSDANKLLDNDGDDGNEVDNEYTIYIPDELGLSHSNCIVYVDLQLRSLD